MAESAEAGSDAGKAAVSLSERRLSDLTDHERASLAAALRDQEVSKRPLVSAYEPISSLRQEYEGAPFYLKKIDALERSEWKAIRRFRGDGDCFYRSFAFAYVERLLHDAPETAKLALERIKSYADAMPAAGFQKDITDEFFEPLFDLLSSLSPDSEKARPTAQQLLEQFNDDATSNYIVYALRLLTSAFIKTHADDFAPFLFGLEDDPRFANGQPPTLEEFCSSYVEAVSKEADHIQLTALTRALQVHMRVAYLDQSGSGDAVDFHEFEPDAKESLECALLYRPGHYDILYKSEIDP